MSPHAHASAGTSELEYECRNCHLGYHSHRVRCLGCGGEDMLREKIRAPSIPRPHDERDERPEEDQKAAPELKRLSTGSGEIDRVLGGGAVRGYTYAISGPPGIGKSTLTLGTAIRISETGSETLVATAEEMTSQVEERAYRLGLEPDSPADDKLDIVESVNMMDVARAAFESTPEFIVGDSVSTFIAPGCDSEPGSVAQMKAVGQMFIDIAHRTNAVVFLIVHINKDGDMAGPKALEHMVDAVLHFDGQEGHTLRRLWASKNRGGKTTEEGIFEMGQKGLTDVDDPSTVLLAERPILTSGKVAAGSVVAALVPTGRTRAMLVEVQALVGNARMNGSGRRSVVGATPARLATLLAVLSKLYPQFALGARDINVNVIGGLDISEPAIDAALSLAILSSASGVSVDPKLAVFGEMGLAGELRSSAQTIARVAQAGRSGFTHAILPSQSAQRLPPEEIPEGMNLLPATNIVEAVEFALGDIEPPAPPPTKKKRVRRS